MTKGARILLADDEEDFLKYTATLFRNSGYECDCVSDARSAVDKLKARRYDAVISDIRMPGNADLRLAREAARLQMGVPIILITAYPSTDSAIPAVSLPVKAYVEKPVEFDELLSTVDGAIVESHFQRVNGICPPNVCARTKWFVNFLKSIADELLESRNAFKSRRLGRLRHRIEATVKRLKSEVN